MLNQHVDDPDPTLNHIIEINTDAEEIDETEANLGEFFLAKLSSTLAKAQTSLN